MLRSENVRDDDVVEKAGDGLARVSIAAALTLFLSRASFFAGHCVETQTRRVSCARGCASWLPRMRLFVFNRYIRQVKKKSSSKTSLAAAGLQVTLRGGGVCAMGACPCVR